MGGSLAVTIREDDGTEHRMCRWTNSLPWFVNHIGFVNKDPEHIRGYLQEWEKMRDDFLQGKRMIPKAQQDPLIIKAGYYKEPQYQYPMTDAYAPHPYLAPEDYGLVVLDFPQNLILTCQGYSSFGMRIVDQIAIDLEAADQYRAFDDAERIQCISVPERLRLVKVPAAEARHESQMRWEFSENDIDNPSLSIEELLGRAALARLEGRERPGPAWDLARIFFDMSPFTIEDFEPDGRENRPAALEAMRDRILGLGFTLSAEEQALWDRYIQQEREE